MDETPQCPVDVRAECASVLMEADQWHSRTRCGLNLLICLALMVFPGCASERWMTAQSRCKSLPLLAVGQDAPHWESIDDSITSIDYEANEQSSPRQLKSLEPDWDSPSATDQLPRSELPELEKQPSPSITDPQSIFASTPNDLSLFATLGNDYRRFYGQDSLLMLGGGLAVGGVIANTSADRQLLSSFRATVDSSGGDVLNNSLKSSKIFGEGTYTLPVFAVAWAAGELFDANPALATTGEWGGRSLRGIAVGAPPMLALQCLTGASRPEEGGSAWHPLQDDNGVSGHSFMAAVPFITAAKMCDDPLQKSLCYAGSTLGALSRVNDSAHYPSQAALGWWVAYLAASAVDHDPMCDRSVQFLPFGPSGQPGAFVEYRY